MKKTIGFAILVIASAMVLASCTKNEVRTSTPQVFTGDNAFVNVVISDAGATSSAATRAEFGGYEYGTSEQSVSSAHFYFYDELGEYVTSASVWKDGTANETPAESIEYTGSTVIVLENLNGKNFPKYMVTILNVPESFTPALHLTDLISQYSEGASDGIYDEEGNFVMSTSSFAGQTDVDNEPLPYYVNEIKESNLSPEPIDENTQATPVYVYVERLAAKVTLTISVDPAEGCTSEDGNRPLYPLHTTVAGDPNADDYAEGEGVEDLYIDLIGWRLNGTSKNSYMFKNISEDWLSDNNLLSFNWNDSTNHRSYWAMSPSYNETEFDEDSEYLNFYDLSDDSELHSVAANSSDSKEVEYCAENTNKSENVSTKYFSGYTGVLVKARICNADGSPVDTLVRYEGMLWEKERYIDYALELLNERNDLNAWYAVTDTDPETNQTSTSYKQIDAQYFYLRNTGNGKVYITVNSEATDGVTFYTASNGVVDTDSEADLTTIQGHLDTFNAYASADCYADGLMYYDIPIEHANTSSGEEGAIVEANYGVVRNHSYYLNISQLASLGKGIYDPSEIIVPTDELESYYVAAQIYILSWRVVEQDVQL